MVFQLKMKTGEERSQKELSARISILQNKWSSLKHMKDKKAREVISLILKTLKDSNNFNDFKTNIQTELLLYITRHIGEKW